MAANAEFLTKLEKELLVSRYFDLEFLDDVSELRCGRCERVLINHYFANCGHAFCLNCKNIFELSEPWKCPKCHVVIQKIVDQNLELEKKVNQLKAHCLNHKYGCEFKGPLKDITVHLKSCRSTRDAAMPRMLSDSEINLSETILKLREEQEKLNVSNTYFKKKIVKLEVRNSTLEGLVSVLDEKYKTMEEMNLNLEKKKEFLTGKIDKLEEEKTKLENVLDKEKETNGKMKNKLMEEKQKYAELEDIIVNIKKSINIGGK